jgi:transposase
VVRTTWAPKGQTPTIQSSGSWKSLSMAGMIKFTPRCNNPELFFYLQPGSMDRYDFVKFLKNIKTEMKGKKLLLIWDRLPAHRSKIVTKYVKSQAAWLRVEHYPGYAPELSPIEFMWSAMKGKDLAHVPPKGLKHLKRLVRKSVKRIKSDKQLLKGFLKKAYVLS